MKIPHSVLLILLACVGCTPSDVAPNESQGSTDIEIDVEACLGTEMPYLSGQTMQGMDGKFTVELIDITPEPTIGIHVARIRLLDTEGAPVTGAEFNLDKECSDSQECTNTWTPIHGHVGGSRVEVDEEGNGIYRVRELTVVHAGSWKFQFNPVAAGVEDFIVFHYCIENSGNDDHRDHSDHGHHAH